MKREDRWRKRKSSQVNSDGMNELIKSMKTVTQSVKEPIIYHLHVRRPVKISAIVILPGVIEVDFRVLRRSIRSYKFIIWLRDIY